MYEYCYLDFITDWNGQFILVISYYCDINYDIIE